MSKRELPEAQPVVVRRVIPVPRERVFDAWLDPAQLARFMRPGGVQRATAEVDPRVGGRFRIVMHHARDAAGTEHVGEYLLIDRPARLVFTWRSEHTNDRDTTVTIDFLEHERGTEMVLTHTRLPPPEADSHRQGWTGILGRLAEELP